MKSIKNLFRRILARLLDYSIFYFATNILFTFSSIHIDERSILIFLLFLPLFFIPFETLFLTLLGTTPGKALFGLRVRTAEGKKLSIREATMRSLSEGWKNLIPINLGYLLYFVQTQGEMPLDKKHQFSVETFKRSKFRTILGSLLLGLSFTTFFFEEELVQKMTKSGGLFQFVGGSKEWSAFTQTKEEFSIQFPKTPEEINKKLPVPGGAPLDYFEHMFKSDDDVIYSVSYTTLPNSLLKWSSGLVLKGSIKIIATQLTHAEIRTKRVVQWKEHPALDFRLYQPGREIQGRLILIGSTLYKVEVNYPNELKNDVSENVSYFVESFSPNYEKIIERN